MAGSIDRGLMLELADLKRRLEVLETIEQSPDGHVKARTNAGQNIPNAAWTTVIWEDEDWDTNGEYNAATGQFPWEIR